jgi:superfamily II RNA helicase
MVMAQEHLAKAGEEVETKERFTDQGDRDSKRKATTERQKDMQTGDQSRMTQNSLVKHDLKASIEKVQMRGTLIEQNKDLKDLEDLDRVDENV